VGVRACVRCVCACERACSKNGGAKKLHHGKKSNPHKVLLLLLLLLLFGDRQREREYNMICTYIYSFHRLQP